MSRRFVTLDDRDDGGSRQRVMVVYYKRQPGMVIRWTDSCSGCTETLDGHNVNGYPFDEKAKCLIGSGCRECGYQGKVRRTAWVPLMSSEAAQLKRAK